MQEAAVVLEQFGIAYELTIASAHRTPERSNTYARTAFARGLKVIIAGAGGAAHLAGVVAANTSIPVIGVPIQSGALSGYDSLLSTVQMPPGVPVACVAINGAKNAGLLAVQILSTHFPRLEKKLTEFKKNLSNRVNEKAAKLEQVGYKKYLEPTEKKDTVLPGINLQEFGKKYSGKVRDFYIKSDKRILITTDRQSAFDVVLGHVPYKGAVLNQLAAFWFKKTKHIVPNHIISIPDPNVTIAHNLAHIPIEVIVRGYLSGVTKTSIWYSYQQGERTIYGIKFKNGMIKNQQLPRPIITPTTHGGGKGGHDERLTRDQIIKKKIVGEKIYTQIEETALKLFKFGSMLCRRHGLILVDTKYEFGLYKGTLMLMDEIHTPDSSRFWKADTYKARIKKGLEPENFDKEFLRLYYVNQFNYRGDGPPPALPEKLTQRLSKRYMQLYEMITGKPFDRFSYPIEERITQALSSYYKNKKI